MPNTLLGYAKVKDRDAFRTWIVDHGIGEIDAKTNTPESGWWYGMWSSYGYKHQNIFSRNENDGVHVVNLFETRSMSMHEADSFFAMLERLSEENQMLSYWYKDETACIIGYGQKRYVMPSEWFTFIPLKNYNRISGNDVRQITNGNETLFPASMYYNAEDVENTKNYLKEETDSLKKEQEQILSGEEASIKDLHEKIQKMQAELEERQKELMEELSRKKSELEEKKKELNRKMYILDTQIYGIRCYTGETVHFHQIREGRKTETAEPVVLYQKIRFLDEELGKYFSIYGNDGAEKSKESFLDILKARDDIANLFAPSEKCVSIICVSRTGKTVSPSEDVANVLQEYEIYHGKQLAMLIRDGENLYIAWFDDDRVTVQDENAFYIPGKSEYAAEDEINASASSTEDKVSRYFMFSVLQGVLDKGEILALPEKVNVFTPGKYLVFSTAEGWIADNTYGTFAEILQKSDGIELKKGDTILVGRMLSRDDAYGPGSGRYHARYASYNNNRGIGERNRTHDAYIKSGIQKINKVLYDYELEVTYVMEEGEISETEVDNKWIEEKMRRADIILPTGKELGTGKSTLELTYDSYCLQKYLEAETEEERVNAVAKQDDGNWYYVMDGRHVKSTGKSEPVYVSFSLWKAGNEKEYTHFRKRYTGVRILKKHPHYFVSVKAQSYTGTTFCTNMEILKDEFVSAAYLCPTWVKYAIRTGNIGDFRISGQRLPYTGALKYLKQLLEYTQAEYDKTEEMVRGNGMSSWMEDNPDWDVQIAEWRIAHKVRNMTEYQVQRFAAEQKRKEEPKP